MKRWFSILSGKTTSTPAEIAGEIEKLQVEQSDVSARLAAAKETLETARLAVYRGQGNQSDVDTQERGVKALEAQAGTLSRAVLDLDKKHAEAVAQERQKQIDDLNKQIADLKQWGREIRPEYIRARLVCDAFERLFTAPTMGVGIARKDELLITGRERAEYQAEADAITQGHGSIMAEILELRRQRDALAKG